MIETIIVCTTIIYCVSLFVIAGLKVLQKKLTKTTSDDFIEETHGRLFAVEKELADQKTKLTALHLQMQGRKSMLG